MIRLVGFLLFGSVFLAVATGLSVWLFLVPMAALAVAAYTMGGLALRCPACQQRIKLGARACRHCGRTVAEAREDIRADTADEPREPRPGGRR